MRPCGTPPHTVICLRPGKARSPRGATLGEYALILIAILLLAGGAYKLLGNPTGQSAVEARRWLDGEGATMSGGGSAGSSTGAGSHSTNSGGDLSSGPSGEPLALNGSGNAGDTADGDNGNDDPASGSEGSASPGGSLSDPSGATSVGGPTVGGSGSADTSNSNGMRDPLGGSGASSSGSGASSSGASSSGTSTTTAGRASQKPRVIGANGSGGTTPKQTTSGGTDTASESNGAGNARPSVDRHPSGAAPETWQSRAKDYAKVGAQIGVSMVPGASTAMAIYGLAKGEETVSSVLKTAAGEVIGKTFGRAKAVYETGKAAYAYAKGEGTLTDVAVNAIGMVGGSKSTETAKRVADRGGKANRAGKKAGEATKGDVKIPDHFGGESAADRVSKAETGNMGGAAGTVRAKKNAADETPSVDLGRGGTAQVRSYGDKKVLKEIDPLNSRGQSIVLNQADKERLTDELVADTNKVREALPKIVPKTEKAGPGTIVQDRVGGLTDDDLLTRPYEVRVRAEREMDAAIEIAEKKMKETGRYTSKSHGPVDVFRMPQPGDKWEYEIDRNAANFRFDEQGRVTAWFDPIWIGPSPSKPIP